MLRILLFALLVHASHSWMIESTHIQVIANTTENVTIQCYYDNNDNERQRMKEVVRILIHKYDENNTKHGLTYAKACSDHSVLLHKAVTGVTVRGHVDKVNNSFLSVTWSKSSQDTAGNYSCEVHGFGDDDTYVRVDTDTVSIVEAPIYLRHLLAKIANLRAKSEQIQKKLNDDIDLLKSNVQSELRNMTFELKGLKGMKWQEDIKKKEVASIVKFKVEESMHDRQKWPGGRYALLNTVNGCPKSTAADWLEGYIKFHSESDKSESHDAVSNPNHMATPIFENDGTENFFYIRTCKRATDSPGPAWPKGSYCVHRVDGTCPTGFEDGTMRLDPDDDPGLYPEHVNAPDFTTTDATMRERGVTYLYIHFCCRQDGDYSEPMSLPVAEPFFLYRYKGECQRVHNTNVTEEWFTIDTEARNNGDKYVNGTFPDSSLSPANFCLCYYRHLG